MVVIILIGMIFCRVIFLACSTQWAVQSPDDPKSPMNPPTLKKVLERILVQKHRLSSPAIQK